MKFLLSSLYCVFLFLLGTQVLLAQKVSLKGTVLSIENDPLTAATIETKTSFATSDIDGGFSLNIPIQDSYQLTIRMLGYVTIDTTITRGLNKIHLIFQMQPIVYEQATAEITASRFNAFQQKEWRILDGLIHQEELLLLYLYGAKRMLGRFDQTGFLIQKMELKASYQNLFRSCLGQIHIIGRQTCAELDADTFAIRKTYKRSIFEELVQPCVAKLGEQFIFKNLSNHNKQAKYFYYPQPKQPILLKEIYDRKAAKVAQQVYHEIIRLYHRSLASPEEGAIDEGFERSNIIQEGTWSGDLFDLVIHHELVTAVSYYQNVESQAIPVLEFEANERLFILDFVQEELHVLSTTRKNQKLSLDLFNWDKKTQILKDGKTNDIYFLSSSHQLYKFEYTNERLNLTSLPKMKLNGFFQRIIGLHGQQLFFFSHTSMTNPHTKLYKIQIP